MNDIEYATLTAQRRVKELLESLTGIMNELEETPECTSGEQEEQLSNAILSLRDASDLFRDAEAAIVDALVDIKALGV